MLSLKEKSCKRCGGAAKAAIVVVDANDKLGTGYPLCDSCKKIVMSVIEDVDPILAAAAFDDGILAVEWCRDV